MSASTTAFAPIAVTRNPRMMASLQEAEATLRRTMSPTLTVDGIAENDGDEGDNRPLEVRPAERRALRVERATPNSRFRLLELESRR